MIFDDEKKLCFVSDGTNGRPVLFMADLAGGKAMQIAGLVGSERVSPTSHGMRTLCAVTVFFVRMLVFFAGAWYIVDAKRKKNLLKGPKMADIKKEMGILDFSVFSVSSGMFHIFERNWR